LRDKAGLLPQDAPGVVDELLAFDRQPRAAALLDEQRATELLLEPSHVHRDGRLRLVHALGGASEGALVHNGEEGAKLVCVEHGINRYSE
jgi:hypothetical protein